MHCFIKAGHVLPSFTPKFTRVEYRVDGHPIRKIKIQDSKPLTSLFLVMTTASLTLSPCLYHACHFPQVGIYKCDRKKASMFQLVLPLLT